MARAVRKKSALIGTELQDDLKAAGSNDGYAHIKQDIFPQLYRT